MRTSINNVKEIVVERHERQYTTDEKEVKYISLDVVAKTDMGDFHFNFMSPNHDNWTDATKELSFSKLLPNTIIIGQESPF